ncbi:MAG: hypothetical protein ABJC24_05000 [Chloroflexota bacterium]
MSNAVPSVLVIIGMVLLLLGVLGDSNLPLIIVGLLIVVGAGLLQLRIARRV